LLSRERLIKELDRQTLPGPWPSRTVSAVTGAELTNGPKGRDFGPYRSASLKWSNTSKGFKHLKYESTVVISTDDKDQIEA
jgi:hypothetical protein